MWARARVLALWTLMTAFCAHSDALQCNNRSSAVATFPAGDIPVRYGDPLEIYCSVEPPYNSSQLGLVRIDKAHKPKPERDIKPEKEILNQTTARFYIAKPERQYNWYDCKLKGVKDFCSMIVVVDWAPEPITNFKCRSYNLERLICSWQPPIHYINTDYSLTYELYERWTLPCTVIRQDNNYSCLFGKNGTKYRNQEEFYKFTLTSNNTFGNITQKFEINHFAVLIPNKPYNLGIELGPHSALLRWHLPRDIAIFSPPAMPPVAYKIKYQIKTVNNLTTWNHADVSSVQRLNKTVYMYNLDNLSYAHWQYDVRVYIKPWQAPDEDEFWAFEATTFTTLSDKPQRPPSTELGAFHAEVLGAQLRVLRVYWQRLEEYEESGDNFTYIMQATCGERTYTQTNRSSSAQFKAPLNACNISITSSNNEGTSKDKSYIYIPASSDILEEPTRFTKTIHENGIYELFWYPPKDDNFDGYTLFWCIHTDSVQSKQCSGKLFFTKLSRTTNNHTITVSEDGTYQFAISANQGQLSSGMVYADCILPLTGAINTVTYFKRGAAVGSRYVELLWDLGCAYSDGRVKGYNITFCKVANDSTHCTGTEEYHYLIENPNQNAVNITELIPHTTYDFKIVVIYHDGVGHPSPSVGATTLEEKPSQPLNLKISEVTNQSMIVSWEPPALKNGILQPYIITYCENDEHKCTNVKSENPNREERQEISLKGLQPYSNYTVTVKACTTDCSEDALAGVVRLPIGAPAAVEKISINESTLYWKPPSLQGGVIDHYEIQILKSEEVEKTFQSHSLFLPNVPGCEIANSNVPILYRVRAVNVDSENDHGAKVVEGNVTLAKLPEGEVLHMGNWSNSDTIQCNITPIPVIILWALGVVMVVVFTILTALGSRKIWIRFKSMTDIGPVLPPGLGPAEEKESSKYPLSGAWSPPGKEGRDFPHIAGDEVLLLPPPPPPRRAAHSGSSNSTDSTTLSLTSKGPGDCDATPSDDNSDESSLHLHSAAVDRVAPPAATTATGYEKWSDAPTEPAYNDDTGSTASDDLSDPVLPSGYVQTSVLPLPASERPGHISNIPTGYVLAQDTSIKPQFISTIDAPRPLAPLVKPVLPTNTIAPKFLPMEWKLPSPRPATPEVGKTTALPMRAHAPTQSGPGYVSHADAVINKHLSIVSGGPLGEDPALPDPNMSPEAYCRFAWNSDPTDDNLDSLLSEDPVPTAHHFALQAPK